MCHSVLLYTGRRPATKAQQLPRRRLCASATLVWRMPNLLQRIGRSTASVSCVTRLISYTKTATQSSAVGCVRLRVCLADQPNSRPMQRRAKLPVCLCDCCSRAELVVATVALFCYKTTVPIRTLSVGWGWSLAGCCSLRHSRCHQPIGCGKLASHVRYSESALADLLLLLPLLLQPATTDSPAFMPMM